MGNGSILGRSLARRINISKYILHTARSVRSARNRRRRKWMMSSVRMKKISGPIVPPRVCCMNNNFRLLEKDKNFRFLEIFYSFTVLQLDSLFIREINTLNCQEFVGPGFVICCIRNFTIPGSVCSQSRIVFLILFIAVYKKFEELSLSSFAI